MTADETNLHGGDLDYIERKYHIAKKDILNFSGNVNPLGFPENVKKIMAENLDILSTYPDKDYVELKRSIGQYAGTKPEYILVGNGATEIISLFVKIMIKPGDKTVIVVPAYSEYERELQIVRGNYEYFHLKEKDDFNLDLDTLLAKIDGDLRLLILCNPNNPTGTAVYPKQMETILRRAQETNTFVMVDETYVEFTDDRKEISSISLTETFSNLLVIRGISKFFAAPGLRLGYCVCSHEEIRKKINWMKDSWSVNILADLAGRLLFQERSFINATKQLIASEREYIYHELSLWKQIRVFSTEANFILLKTDHVPSHHLYEHLIAKKMLVRDASSFVGLNPYFLRFCFLTPDKNRMLLAELKKLLS